MKEYGKEKLQQLKVENEKLNEVNEGLKSKIEELKRHDQAVIEGLQREI